MMLESLGALRVQDAVEIVTDAEKRGLDELARKLRTLAAGDVLAELEYHDSELNRCLDWLVTGEFDADATELTGYLVNDHRRRRDLCAAELSRRNHADRLPSGGARSRITRELIDEIKSRVDLADLMESRGIELKMRGSKGIGLCPFHTDKTPSLSVNAERGLWHCFGCNVGGDSVRFAMMFNKLDFVPALKLLADRAGIELPYPATRLPQMKAANSPTDTNQAQQMGVDTTNYLPLDDILAAFGRGETGDAEILARLFADKIAFDHAEDAWVLFGDHSWRRDEIGAVRAFVTDDVAAQYLFAAAETKRRDGDGETADKRIKELYARANGLRYRNKIGNVLSLAASQPALALRGDEWGKDAMLLGVSNGVVNLRATDFEFRPGAPRDYIRTTAPTVWQDLYTPAPRWGRFLDEIFAGDTGLISFVQRLFGYGITGETNEHIFPVLWGEGRNGKDTLLETLKFVLGDCAAPVQSDVLLATDRNPNAATPHLYALRGKRLCWVNETNEGARLNASQVKLLTGGGTIAARPLYGAPVTFAPQFLLMLVTNHKPHANADDYALWKRLLLIPFTQAFVDSPRAPNERQRDARLAETLRGEASGILAWLVRGCLEWQNEGLNPPESVRTATDEYQSQEDTFAEFVAARCVVGANAESKAAELYATYRQWAADNGLAPMSGLAFWKRISKRFSKKRTERGNVYVGIGILASV